MTDIIFSFDTEDFTSNAAADAIFEEAEILREEGVKGCFCVVGLLAGQLQKWGRKDVVDALRHHEIASHSYGHSLHPTINEYTDLADFEEAYNRVIKEERQALDLLKQTFGIEKVSAACPPGNQKSYAAMYAYADMGIPIYADTYCDTEDGRGVYYCNIYNVIYSYCMETTFFEAGPEDLKRLLDRFAAQNRVVLYTHPNISLFYEFWDTVNYNKGNRCQFGEWKECRRRPREMSDKFYENLRMMARLIKNDERFRITTYSEIADELARENARKITLDSIADLYKAISEQFYPVANPVSYCLSDMFLGCRDLLLGKEEHICGKVYGFLETPYAISEETVLTKDDIIKSALDMKVTKFLPNEIVVGSNKVGPGDWLRAAMGVLLGKEVVTLKPGLQMPALDLLPQLKDCSLLGWLQSDEFKDEFLSKRLKLQAWTMRFRS